MTLNMPIFDSWFGFVYEIALYISDAFYAVFFKDDLWAYMGGLFILVAIMSLLIRGIVIQSSMGEEGYTSYWDRVWRSDFWFKLFIGGVLIGCITFPVTVRVHYSANRLIPSAVINIVFKEFGINQNQQYSSQNTGNRQVGDSQSVNQVLESSEHKIPAILALPIYLFDIIIFGKFNDKGELDQKGILPSVFDHYYTMYTNDPESIPKSYLQFYFNKDVYDEAKSKLLNASLSLSGWYSKTIPDTLNAFGFGQDNEKMKIYRGRLADTLNVKAGIQQLLYLMLKGYDEGFKTFSELTYNGEPLDDEKLEALSDLSSNDTVKRIIAEEFKVKEQRERRGANNEAITGYYEFKSIPTKADLVKAIMFNEGGIDENKSSGTSSNYFGKKYFSTALGIAMYPLLVTASVSAVYLNNILNGSMLAKAGQVMNVTGTDSLLGGVAQGAAAGTLASAIGGPIGILGGAVIGGAAGAASVAVEKAATGAAELFANKNPFFYYANVQNMAALQLDYPDAREQLKSMVESNVDTSVTLPEVFEDQLKLNSSDVECNLSFGQELGNMFNTGECYASIFSYIDKYTPNDVKKVRGVDETINLFVDFIDQYLTSPMSVEKVAEKIYPTSGMLLAIGLSNKYKNNNNEITKALQIRRDILINGIKSLKSSTMAENNQLVDELSQLDALLNFYTIFNEQINTAISLVDMYKMSGYGALQALLFTNIGNVLSNTSDGAVSETKANNYQKELNNIAWRENAGEVDTGDINLITSSLFNWLSNDQSSGITGVLKGGALILVRGLMLFFTLLFLLLSFFMFLQFFLMRSIHGAIYFMLWPVHVIKVILSSDITKFKVLFKDWLTFRGYDIVLLIALVMSGLFIECCKVFYLYGLNIIKDENVQSIYGNVMISLFSFITFQLLRLLYQQYCKLIEQTDSVFAQSLGRIADSMTASAGVFSSVALSGAQVARQIGGGLGRLGIGGLGRIKDRISGGGKPSGPDGADLMDKIDKGS